MRLGAEGSQVQAVTFLLAAYRRALAAGDHGLAAQAAYRLALVGISDPAVGGTRGASLAEEAAPEPAPAAPLPDACIGLAEFRLVNITVRDVSQLALECAAELSLQDSEPLLATLANLRLARFEAGQAPAGPPPAPPPRSRSPFASKIRRPGPSCSPASPKPGSTRAAPRRSARPRPLRPCRHSHNRGAQPRGRARRPPRPRARRRAGRSRLAPVRPARRKPAPAPGPPAPASPSPRRGGPRRPRAPRPRRLCRARESPSAAAALRPAHRGILLLPLSARRLHRRRRARTGRRAGLPPASAAPRRSSKPFARPSCRAPSAANACRRAPPSAPTTCCPARSSSIPCCSRTGSSCSTSPAATARAARPAIAVCRPTARSTAPASPTWSSSSSSPCASAAAARGRARPAPLYDLLIAPIAGQLGPDAMLAIVPDGPLRMLPFAALVAPDGRFLVEQARLSLIPGARLFRAGRQPPRRTPRPGRRLARAPHGPSGRFLPRARGHRRGGAHRRQLRRPVSACCPISPAPSSPARSTGAASTCSTSPPTPPSTAAPTAPSSSPMAR